MTMRMLNHYVYAHDDFSVQFSVNDLLHTSPEYGCFPLCIISWFFRSFHKVIDILLLLPTMYAYMLPFIVLGWAHKATLAL